MNNSDEQSQKESSSESKEMHLRPDPISNAKKSYSNENPHHERYVATNFHRANIHHSMKIEAIPTKKGKLSADFKINFERISPKNEWP